MMLALMLSLPLLGSAPASPVAAARSDDPPVKVWLNQDSYFRRGDRARVKVRLAEDGYLVVLRADARGRVRVLFPLDPGDDAFVRGGETIEVRGRGDREAFYVDEREGSGVVLAARSVAPFQFEEFVRGDHWDYGALDARFRGDDKEAALLDIVRRMSPDGHFDYDVQEYVVAAPRAYVSDYAFGRPAYALHLSFGWGWPYYRFGFFYGYAGSYCFDPFFYDPFFCGPFVYAPFFYDPFFYRPVVYVPFVYRPFVYPPFVRRPLIYYTGGAVFYGQPRSLFVNRLRPGGPGFYVGERMWRGADVGGVGPRLRVPAGTLLGRAGPAVIPVRGRDAAMRVPLPVRERPARAVPVRDAGERDVPVRALPGPERPVRDVPVRERPPAEVPARAVPARERPEPERPVREPPRGERGERREWREPAGGGVWGGARRGGGRAWSFGGFGVREMAPARGARGGGHEGGGGERGGGRRRP
jgi:hypothetical protein